MTYLALALIALGQGLFHSDFGSVNGDWLRSAAEVPVPLESPTLPAKEGQARAESSPSQSPFPRPMENETALALGQGPAPGSDRAANPLYETILAEGLVVGGLTVKLPPPCLREGMTEAERRAALKEVVDLPLDEFLRDSVNAPFKLKVRDVAYPGGVVRVVDLWFAIHADLDEVDLDDLAGKKDQGAQSEAGNMKFSARTLSVAELKGRHQAPEGSLDRYVLSKGVLLDRIEVSTVNHIVASKSGGALVVASMTDPAFNEGELVNRWSPIPGSGEIKKDLGPPRPYEGSAGYSRISRFSEKPTVLLVESHLAFAEPKGWFNGASILRSKFGLIAQDQIRKLRRELAARRKAEGKAAPSTSL